MRMAFDMSSVLWTGLRSGKDEADGIYVDHNGKEKLINSAAFGYENAVGFMVSIMEDWKLSPKDCILVFEGRDSKKRRCMVEPMYKNRPGSEKHSEEYVQFNLLKDKIREEFCNLGAIAVTQDFVEGDDVLAWLANNTEDDMIIVTNDNDLIVLNKQNEYGAKVMVAVSNQIGVNKYGEFDFALVTLYKSLVGDSSDNIKGCPGFGPAAFLKLIGTYGEDGAYELMELVSRGARDELAVLAEGNQCKILGKIVEQWEAVVKSYRLALLHPEWVNTMRQPLVWMPGMVRRLTRDERLVKYRAVNRLVTADNYAAALAHLKAKLADTVEPAFDIETSTPDESDDWLEAQGAKDGVDVFGSYLVGFSITFGKNNEYTYYVSVKHKDTNNISMTQAREMIECLFQHHSVIQNTAFELAVLHEAQDEDGSYWRDHWAAYGEQGFMPKVLDTKLEASYVDENQPMGLKQRSKIHLGYEQATFEQTTRKQGPLGSLPAGGRRIRVWTDGEGAEAQEVEIRQYKMDELTAEEVFGYGADDTICTAALHNFYKLVMQLEHTWKVYLDVEIDACYIHAKSFVDGVKFSLAKMKELEAIDTATFDSAWDTVKEFLSKNAWEGTVAPTYGSDLTAKQIKEAYAIRFGLDASEPDEDDEDSDDEVKVERPKDPILSSRVRTPSKLAILIRNEGHEEFADALEKCLAGGHQEFTEYIREYFTGEPKFKMSNKMMCKLLYEVMGLPVRVRNKPTEKMKAAGIKEGNPKADNLAIAYALRDGTPEQVEVLQGLKLMQMVTTRRNLYYKKYPYLLHWKDGKIHSSHNQCATNTRRASSSGPNLQQLPKHPKIEGQPSRFRETFVPHKPDAVIVSMDFAAQELRVIADYSKDKNMLACFVGDNKKDMHALTGVGILKKSQPGKLESLIQSLGIADLDRGEAEYAAFCSMESSQDATLKPLYKEYRSLGKKVNFTTEYGAAAPKLAMTMLIDEDTAQSYIDAREAVFSEAKEWKQAVVAEAKAAGFVKTKLGAVRHLAALLTSDDKFTASKAERQAVNFKIQSSSAEMTKKAEGRMWRAELTKRYDAAYLGPIHDETVWSVSKSDLLDFMVECHKCMVAPYADMEVPIESSISFGPDFGTQYEIGSVASQEAINDGFAQWAKAA